MTNKWPDTRILDLLGIELPIIQAPMAGANGSDMAIAVSEAGGLGSLPCAIIKPDQIRSELKKIRSHTKRPININFFCHTAPRFEEAREREWRARLEPYYQELGVSPDPQLQSSGRNPFDSTMCDLVEEFRPEVVSFHFGLPSDDLLARVKATDAKVLSSATTVAEAQWLEERGCDAIIAQGYEAGGHRGMFLTSDLSSQIGTMALVPQVVDAVRVPVIATGGIADSRGIAAAFALGAVAVQIGTAYLFCPEATISSIHRTALRNSRERVTALTNVFTGHPARGIVNRIVREVGPMSPIAPEFPLATGAVTPLRSESERRGSEDFVSLWSGQAGSLGKELPAGELTRQLAADSVAKLGLQ